MSEGMSPTTFDRLHVEEKAKERSEQQELIADAEIIRKGLENPPEFWKVLMKYYKRFEERSHADCFNRNGLPGEPIARLVDIEVNMLSHLKIKALIELPQKIMERGSEAIQAIIDEGKDQQKFEELNKSRIDPVQRR